MSKAGSWEGWAGIPSSCVGWIGVYSGAKAGWLVRGGMRGSVFGMSGTLWAHDENVGCTRRTCLLGESFAFAALRWELLSSMGSR